MRGNSTRTRRPEGGARPFATLFSGQHLISNQRVNARKPCNINALGHTMPGQVTNTSPPSHRHAITRTAQRRGRVHSKRTAQRMKRPPNPYVACSLRLGRNPFVAHRVEWYPGGHDRNELYAARNTATPIKNQPMSSTISHALRHRPVTAPYPVLERIWPSWFPKPQRRTVCLMLLGPS